MSRELLLRLTRKDFELEFFRSGGHGGQNQNKVSSGVRVRHPASGAVAESRETRDQIENRRRAFARLRDHPKFQSWLRLRLAEQAMHQTIEEYVDEQMRPEYLRTEVHDDAGRWVPGEPGADHE